MTGRDRCPRRSSRSARCPSTARGAALVSRSHLSAGAKTGGSGARSSPPTIANSRARCGSSQRLGAAGAEVDRTRTERSAPASRRSGSRSSDDEFEGTWPRPIDAIDAGELAKVVLARQVEVAMRVPGRRAVTPPSLEPARAGVHGLLDAGRGRPVRRGEPRAVGRALEGRVRSRPLGRHDGAAAQATHAERRLLRAVRLCERRRRSTGWSSMRSPARPLGPQPRPRHTVASRTGPAPLDDPSRHRHRRQLDPRADGSMPHVLELLRGPPPHPRGRRGASSGGTGDDRAPRAARDVAPTPGRSASSTLQAAAGSCSGSAR